jgi:hypothetical protein
MGMIGHYSSEDQWPGNYSSKMNTILREVCVFWELTISVFSPHEFKTGILGLGLHQHEISCQ